MNIEDLSFTIKYENGEELINDVTNVIPNLEKPNEPYVTFTDYTLDKNDEFNEYYGKVIKQDDEYLLVRNLTELEIAYIKDSLNDEVVRFVNDAVMNNIEE